MHQNSAQVYWFGETPQQLAHINIIEITSAKQLPAVTAGILCINYETDSELTQLLKEFYQQQLRWTWCVYTLQETTLSRTITDGVFDEQIALETSQKIKQRLNSAKNNHLIDPLLGWLAVNKSRRLMPYQDTQQNSIYSFPIIDLLVADLYSSYRYALAEQQKGTLEKEFLVDRIRLCPHCNHGHLNYIEVCPSCHSIDIKSQSSLHCFTCGYIADQASFQRQNKLECPKCLTQLRHIGVDYDRPLENLKCNSCASLFIDASTISQCMNCKQNNQLDELVIRSIYQYKLGETGEYTFLNGQPTAVPELSIKGKVDSLFFQSLLMWVNKVAVRHQEHHLLFCLHLPSFNDYSRQYGDAKLFSLIDQLAERLGTVLRETDLCCQYKPDILLVLMPHTSTSSIRVLNDKLAEICALIEEQKFELNVYVWELPDVAINDDAKAWLDDKVNDVYVAR